MGEKRSVYRMWKGTPEGKMPQGRPRYRWKDNIKIVVREIGWGTCNSPGSGYKPVVGSCECASEPGYHRMKGIS
jgi:hypothetical protein